MRLPVTWTLILSVRGEDFITSKLGKNAYISVPIFISHVPVMPPFPEESPKVDSASAASAPAQKSSVCGSATSLWGGPWDAPASSNRNCVVQAPLVCGTLIPKTRFGESDVRTMVVGFLQSDLWVSAHRLQVSGRIADFTS